MSEQKHTQGEITVEKVLNPQAAADFIFRIGPRTLFALYCGSGTDGDAERLAACWNVLAGVDPEAVAPLVKLAMATSHLVQEAGDLMDEVRNNEGLAYDLDGPIEALESVRTILVRLEGSAQ